jgi:hypothetical protein
MKERNGMFLFRLLGITRRTKQSQFQKCPKKSIEKHWWRSSSSATCSRHVLIPNEIEALQTADEEN